MARRAQPIRPFFRHFVYRREVLRTTWTFRIGALVLIALAIWFSWRPLSTAIASDLICSPSVVPADALVLENLDDTYLLFERAVELKNRNVASRVIIPTEIGQNGDTPNAIASGMVELMAGAAGLEDYEVVPIRITEPITLNTVRQVRDVLVRERLNSIVVVVPAFRSRRSELIYHSTMRDAGIATGCAPVFGQRNEHNWTDSMHGIQEVLMEFVKLQYYRFYVLPMS